MLRLWNIQKMLSIAVMDRVQATFFTNSLIIIAFNYWYSVYCLSLLHAPKAYAKDYNISYIGKIVGRNNNYWPPSKLKTTVFSPRQALTGKCSVDIIFTSLVFILYMECWEKKMAFIHTQLVSIHILVYTWMIRIDGIFTFANMTTRPLLPLLGQYRKTWSLKMGIY